MNKPLKMSSLFALIFAVCLIGLGSPNVVSSQDFPTKPIRIVTSAAGGGNDFISRFVAQGISGPIGQPVIVDNRTSNIGPDIVVKSPPDGYTLFLDGGSFWIEPLLRNKPYDPVKDFAPISTISREVSVLVVTPSLPVTSVKELIALIKAKPGGLNYSSSTAGGGSHLAGELFKFMAGINVVWVPHKNTAAAINSVAAGEVQMMISSTGSAMSHVKAGRVKALAVSSTDPSVLAPGLPTIAATIPGYEVASISGMFAPARTPAALINRLNQEVVRYLKTADTKEKFLAIGLETVGSSPEELAIAMKGEINRLGKVIRDAGIRAE